MSDIDLSALGGAALAVVIVVAIALIIAWLWISWVAVGMLIVYFALPSDVILHVFLWIAANTVLSKASRV